MSLEKKKKTASRAAPAAAKAKKQAASRKPKVKAAQTASPAKVEKAVKATARKAATKTKTQTKAKLHKAAPKVKKQVKSAVKAPKQAAKAAADTIQKSVQNIQAFDPKRIFDGSLSNTAMEEVMAQNKVQYEKLAQEAGDLGREGFDAFVKSSTIFAKGLESIVRTSVSLAQQSAEKQAKLTQEALSSKTLNEWTDVQNKIIQENFNDFMEGATKISELSAKVLSEASEPLNEQLSKGLKKANLAA